jgi:hypothetical protein
MFKNLFQQIATFLPSDVKSTYNEGVNALARGNLDKTISLFEQVCE